MTRISQILKRRKHQVGGIFTLNELLEMQAIFETSKSTVITSPLRPPCVFQYDSDMLYVQIPASKWEKFVALHDILLEAIEVKKDLINHSNYRTDNDLLGCERYHQLAEKIVFGYQELLVIARLSSVSFDENVTF